ncbi:TonB-dependent siderophore receptor [Pseudomonas fluorescens]|jgi:iron complex outermembrane recepter protein|uniref:TonB-dependent siderophore receptor n=1 Tax=Pseudomonas fluorescens TaxID=294 RepID=UPI0020C3A00E|nr:TonB-dependent siderophore receptor [Pseudomonas fluorescens]MDI9778752.1 TonB-dependent siderophore receptor [Pseudomonas putida]UTL93051.1 TonB-dependent siderophore receptor [Pseudomonas fluorescens]
MASSLSLQHRHGLFSGLLSLSISPALAWADSTVLEAVTVTAEQPDSYHASTAAVSGFGEAPLLDTPASVAVFTEQLLKDRQARLLSEVLSNDASTGESYAPIGYYENFVVRGFSLSAANSYKINGSTITGEQNVALENKQQVELLKGLSGLQSGVSEPGGLVNYVTKRPQDVHSVTVASNESGERYLATDLGGWLDSEQRLGVRANFAHEDIRSYVENSDGKRDFASLAVDWSLSDAALLQLDAEYQTREQRSVPGYQLLGGNVVPSGIDPKDRLADQHWSKPVGIDSLNLGSRFEYRFDDDWSANLSASRSRVVIDDYSAFAWGCYGAPSCASSAVPNYFSPEGDYDVYDFRSPDDTRRNDELQATLSGRFDSGPLQHELTLGSSALRRIIDRRDAVNEWVGTANIYQPVPDFVPSNAPLGHTYRHLDSRQYGVFFSDRLSYGEHWQAIVGGRQVRLDEKTFDIDGNTTRHTQRSEFLPNVALIYKPSPEISLYSSYSKGLSLGGEAAWFTTNAYEILPPTVSRQLELGAKRDWQGLSFGAALFRISKAYQYSRPNGDGSFTYVQQGEQENIGLELSANGRLTEQLQVAASAAAIRARVEDSGTDRYEGHQAINVPKVRASLHADYSIASVKGLALLGGLRYSASKYASQAGNVKVDGYTVFDAGARYTLDLEGYETVFRLSVDNLFDKRYWRDVGEYMGDGYLFQGAPRTARLSATVNF